MEVGWKYVHSDLMNISSDLTALRTHIEGQRERIFRDLSEIVAFDSVHNEPGHEEDAAGAAEWTR